MSLVSIQRCASVSPAAAEALDPAAEPHRVAHVAARRFPHIAQTQPAAGDFALPAVRADDLRENAVVVADAVADRRILQRGQRIQETGRQPSQAAIAETGIDLLGGDVVQVIAHVAQRGARLLQQAAFQARQRIQQGPPRQILHREIAHPLDVGICHAALRGEPAQRQLLAHRERQRIVNIARRCRVRVLAEGSGQAVQQGRLQGAGLQSDVPAGGKLGIYRVHITGYYRVETPAAAGEPHNARFKLTTPHLAVGVDVGGSSIKCALIDLNTGAFAGERFSTPTPAQGSTESLLAALETVVSNVPGDHAVGLAFPSVIRDGIVRTAANLNKAWIGKPLAAAGRRAFAPAGDRHQRCRRGGPRRAALRRRARRAGHGAAADPGHGHRQRLVRRRASWCRTRSSATCRWRAARPNIAPPVAPRWSRILSWDAWAEQLNLVLKEMQATAVAGSHRALRRHHRGAGEIHGQTALRGAVVRG